MHHLEEIDDISLRTVEYVVCLMKPIASLAWHLSSSCTESLLSWVRILAKQLHEEVLRDRDAAMAKINQAVANGGTVYGHFTHRAIDLLSDRGAMSCRFGLFSERLKAFKPKQTILEAEARLQYRKI
ncbi:dead box ATP-dependent RNA helicase [Striga asiatica]|uniref:Dead box ATP-dependent RNA helicase n=1 Tax=Striga asiatica TaxID=4170 RepID=A0A5A7PN23_STRAF|nr:dead box ATP-dependent RNA helicase [Striga asiatica]